jgi:hypothetical protein
MKRYGAETVHPSNWKRVFDMEGGFDRGVRIGEQRALRAAAPSEWSRLFGVEFLRHTGGGTLIVIMFAIAFYHFCPSILVAILIVPCLGWASYALLALQSQLGSQTPHYSAPSLRLVAREAGLDGAELAYINALIVMSESSAIADSDRADAIRDLNRLMDEYQRLQVVKRSLPKTDETLAKLRADSLNVERQLGTTNDEVTADTLRQSLRIIQQRIAKVAGSAELADRINAETILLTQLLGQLGDSITPNRTMSFDFSDLRERLAAISNRTDETERARQELDA